MFSKKYNWGAKRGEKMESYKMSFITREDNKEGKKETKNELY